MRIATPPNPQTVVELEIRCSALVVSWSDRFPPGTCTLSGIITETTTTGLVAIENAEVWRLDEEQSGWPQYDGQERFLPASQSV